MMHTETHFGLTRINGRISADGGKTLLKPYSEMSVREFNELVFDIEVWIERDLAEKEIEDLKEIFK